jgi:hypothetical protein
MNSSPSVSTISRIPDPVLSTSWKGNAIYVGDLPTEPWSMTKPLRRQSLCKVMEWATGRLPIPVFIGPRVYAIPNTFKTTRTTTITSKTWIQLPARGNLGLILPPRKPNNQSITRITMIVHNMRFLLLSDSPNMLIMVVV